MNNIALLTNIYNHINLTSKEEELLLSKVKFEKFLRGQYVSQGGDICKFINFVISGSLKSFRLDNEGNEHILAFVIEAWWIGDLGSFAAQKPADYTIQCIENCELAQISYEDLQFLFIEIPKLERFFRIVIQNAYVYFQRRIIDNLSLTAKVKYLNFIKQYQQGQLLGKGGTSGNARGSHLHLVINYKGLAINPEYLFDFTENNAIRAKDIWVTNKWTRPYLHSSRRQTKLKLLLTEEDAIASLKTEKKIYVVQRGDTLSKISLKNNISIAAICKTNYIKRNAIIRIGQKLVID